MPPIPPIMLEISRKSVLTGSTEPLVFVLEGMTASPECWSDFCGMVGFAIDGWDDDPREIFQIPEVRVFWAKLDRRFPAWSFFIQPGQLLQSFMLCLVPDVRGLAGRPGGADFVRGDFAHVVRRNLDAVCAECASRGVPTESFHAYCAALTELCRRCLPPEP